MQISRLLPLYILCSILFTSSGKAQTAAENLSVEPSASSAMTDLQFEEQGSIVGAMLPQGILKIADDERYVIWVELNAGRLNLLEQLPDGGLVVQKTIPISIGKNGIGKQIEGDKRTPIGVYRFTDFFTDNELADYYGLGAYPINYPNALDLRLQRTGSGIWLHGLPKGVDQRPYLDSDGCVVIDNNSLLEMAAYIDTGLTHIVLSENEIKWLAVQNDEKERLALDNAVESWRRSWQSIDHDSYANFYAQDFLGNNKNKQQWDSYKRNINSNKTSIAVELSSMSYFVDPKAQDVVNVRYYQRYASSNYNWNGWKEQLWQKQNNQWKIIYEGDG